VAHGRDQQLGIRGRRVLDMGGRPGTAAQVVRWLCGVALPLSAALIATEDNPPMEKDSDRRCSGRISINLNQQAGDCRWDLGLGGISPVDANITANVQKHPSFSSPTVALEPASVDK
jgi:hypothetical protein